jgi:hypothetical protein
VFVRLRDNHRLHPTRGQRNQPAKPKPARAWPAEESRDPPSPPVDKPPF